MSLGIFGTGNVGFSPAIEVSTPSILSKRTSNIFAYALSDGHLFTRSVFVYHPVRPTLRLIFIHISRPRRILRHLFHLLISGSARKPYHADLEASSANLSLKVRFLGHEAVEAGAD